MTSTLRILFVPFFLSLASVSLAQAQSLTFLTEENPPFNFTEGGKPAGLSTAVVTEMAKRAGIEARVESGVWDAAYRRAQSEKNVCLYSTAQLENRRALFSWIGPIATNSWVLVAGPDFKAALRSDADVRKFKVGAVKTDAKAELLRARGITNIVETDSEAQIPALFALAKDDPRRIDLWVSGAYAYRDIAQKAKVSNVKIVYSLTSQPLYLACSPATDKTAVSKLNAALAGMKKDGSLAKLVPAAK